MSPALKSKVSSKHWLCLCLLIAFGVNMRRGNNAARWQCKAQKEKCKTMGLAMRCERETFQPRLYEIGLLSLAYDSHTDNTNRTARDSGKKHLLALSARHSCTSKHERHLHLIGRSWEGAAQAEGLLTCRARPDRSIFGGTPKS